MAKSLVFMLGLAIVLSVTQVVMLPAGVTTDPWAAVKTTRNEADVLALGSSRTYCTVLPMEMWRDRGVTVLDVTGATQPMSVTLSYLQESLRFQRPKVVLLELYMMGKMVPFDIRRAHTNLDRLPPGVPRTEAILRSVDATGWFEALFPLTMYHARWEELGRADFAADKDARSAYARGAYYIAETTSVPEAVAFDEVDETGYQRDLGYLRRIAATCQKDGVTLILFTSPSRWRMTSSGQLLLSRLQGELGPEFPTVRYLDMNTLTGSLGIDPKTDYKDELHLNYKGAVKVSRWIADYLIREFGIADHRHDALARRWNESLRRWDAVIEAKRSRAQARPAE